MEKTFRIVWDDELGPAWMNLDNLAMCLFSEAHIGSAREDQVRVEELPSEAPCCGSVVVNNAPCRCE